MALVRLRNSGLTMRGPSCIEAVNAVIDGLKTLRDRGDATLYDQHYSSYAELLDKLYLNAGFYRGTFTLTSYTQTREWTVYAVNRSLSYLF